MRAQPWSCQDPVPCLIEFEIGASFLASPGTTTHEIGLVLSAAHVCVVSVSFSHPLSALPISAGNGISVVGFPTLRLRTFLAKSPIKLT